MIKIVSVVGARPQFIKAAVVSRAVAAHNQGKNSVSVREIIVHTGQHFDDQMSQVFFDEMGIPAPDYNLGIGGLSHGAMTGRMIEAIEDVLVSETPDFVLVYGDTNSTLAGALAAAKLNIPVAHVEAGLRSFNRRMPEEINRVLTDHVAQILFAPTEVAVKNLLREGVSQSMIHLVGDVMYDAVLFHEKQAEEQSGILDKLGVNRRDYMLVTLHRAENTDSPARLKAIFEGLAKVASDMRVVFPLHPRTRNKLLEMQIDGKVPERLNLIEPVGYIDMVILEKYALAIATDSGGVQKEAYFHRVPCVTLREETEWTELLEIGANRLVAPLDAITICDGIRAALAHRGPEAGLTPLYGDGRAGVKIVGTLAATAVGNSFNSTL